MGLFGWLAGVEGALGLGLGGALWGARAPPIAPGGPFGGARGRPMAALGGPCGSLGEAQGHIQMPLLENRRHSKIIPISSWAPHFDPRFRRIRGETSPSLGTPGIPMGWGGGVRKKGLRCNACVVSTLCGWRIRPISALYLSALVAPQKMPLGAGGLRVPLSPTRDRTPHAFTAGHLSQRGGFGTNGRAEKGQALRNDFMHRVEILHPTQSSPEVPFVLGPRKRCPFAWCSSGFFNCGGGGSLREFEVA